ncbi:MAG TPA: hypothetical protein VH394_10715 [Thermoanaerobaculia bacterium]|jgi:hypothetical protein|nr:hypothetical protein [Thermoanaerobaculia bacterium]
MSKLSRIVIGSVVFWMALAGLHLWLNLGVDPRTALGLKKETTEDTTRFRVGFLPVT